MKMIFELKELKKLINLFQKSNITALSLEDKNGEKILIKKDEDQFMAAPSRPVTIKEQIKIPLEEEDLSPAKAPMVGTFYIALDPGSEPFVTVGSYIKEGDVIGIITAIKVNNDIKAGVSGTITEILVENGKAVEYGQPLMLIKAE